MSRAPENIVLFSPFSRALRDKRPNAKNYPYWTELIKLFAADGRFVVQIGATGEDRLPGVQSMFLGPTPDQLENLLKDARTWVSVDNFLPHMAAAIGIPGVVLFGMSDPEIFGHPENFNILKGREHLRADQFAPWEGQDPEMDAWLTPAEVLKKMKAWEAKRQKQKKRRS